MSFNKGEIVIVKFPFVLKEQGEIQKGRPALILSHDVVQRRFTDIALAAITSQIPDNIMALEIILEPTELTGLKKRSLLKLDFIMTVPSDLISRKIGAISDDIMAEVDMKLKLQFGLNE
jgi:mRNA-degrading endonuclease toxin of MazEF toxin-antitoxin module